MTTTSVCGGQAPGGFTEAISVENLGTVRDLVKQDGTVAEHFEYDAFGRVVSGDTSLTRYLFTSREFDAETGLQYNRARWYDADVGRWASEDPSGLRAGDANVNRYVGNDPSNRSGPSGLVTRLFYGSASELMDVHAGDELVREGRSMALNVSGVRDVGHFGSASPAWNTSPVSTSKSMRRSLLMRGIESDIGSRIDCWSCSQPCGMYSCISSLIHIRITTLTRIQGTTDVEIVSCTAGHWLHLHRGVRR